MGSARVEMSSAGIEAVLSDPAVTAMLMAMGDSIAAEAESRTPPAPNGHRARYSAKAHGGREGGRPYVDVAAVDDYAVAHNARHNTLVKSMDAGRR